jgi:hypothetical protein
LLQRYDSLTLLLSSLVNTEVKILPQHTQGTKTPRMGPVTEETVAQMEKQQQQEQEPPELDVKVETTASRQVSSSGRSPPREAASQ